MNEVDCLVAEMVPVKPRVPSAGPDVLRPSEYSALLLHALSLRAGRIKGARVMEVGVGSGVVLAGMAQLGAAHLTGVDVEALAVQRTAALLAEMPNAPPHRLVQGSMWVPFDRQQFDVIVANLPHFPAHHVSQPTRFSSWSNSGADGRRMLNQLIAGLSAHLAPNGLALVVHSVFTDLELSRSQLAQQGLEMQPLATTLIQIELEKLRMMSPVVRKRFTGVGIKQFGSYVFGVTHVIEVTHALKSGTAATP